MSFSSESHILFPKAEKLKRMYKKNKENDIDSESNETFSQIVC